MKSFEDLLVWQKSLELAVQLCQMQETRADLNYRAEIVITACGIPAHIADATAAPTSAAFGGALDKPVSLAYRLETLIRIGVDLGFIPATARASVEARAEEVRKMLVALRASVLRDDAGPGRRSARVKEPAS